MVLFIPQQQQQNAFLHLNLFLVIAIQFLQINLQICKQKKNIAKKRKIEPKQMPPECVLLKS